MFHLQDAQKECLLVNAPLICRAASRVPFSVLKYAMTLDGEIDLPLLDRSQTLMRVSVWLIFTLLLMLQEKLQQAVAMRHG